MDWTRREFMVTTGAALTATTLDPPLTTAERPAPPAPHDDPAFLAGDPYLACADGCGLGGRSFEDARQRALRFRTPAALRDAHVLGLPDA